MLNNPIKIVTCHSCRIWVPIVVYLFMNISHMLLLYNKAKRHYLKKIVVCEAAPALSTVQCMRRRLLLLLSYGRQEEVAACWWREDLLQNEQLDPQILAPP